MKTSSPGNTARQRRELKHRPSREMLTLTLKIKDRSCGEVQEAIASPLRLSTEGDQRPTSCGHQIDCQYETNISKAFLEVSEECIYSNHICQEGMPVLVTTSSNLALNTAV
jgi:hypothetical protein